MRKRNSHHRCACLVKAQPNRRPPNRCSQTIHHVMIASRRSHQTQEATDQEKNLITKFITQGWPDSAKGLPKDIHHYWWSKEGSSIDNSLVFRSVRLIIPEVLIPEILDRLHDGHQGITKCQLYVHPHVYIYWPDITKDIVFIKNTRDHTVHNLWYHTKYHNGHAKRLEQTFSSSTVSTIFWLQISNCFSKDPLVWQRWVYMGYNRINQNMPTGRFGKWI